MDMFEKLGITCDSIRDKETRKLIFVNEDLKLKFFLAKASDVPTYVEYGAADIGIVGEDTILEEGRNLYEVMDLGFGKCKMCVCGPESAREKLQHGELIRVASKYPSIAKDYFYNKKLPDRRDYQVKRFGRVSSDCRAFRSYRRYRRDWLYIKGKRAYSLRGNL
jgi:hisG: ATP phosphoribosyltransferase